MPIPQVKIDDVSQENFGVYTAMSAAMSQLGNAVVAFFLDQVPERGEKLWQRFRAFQGEHEGTTFIDFIKNVVTANPLKLFYPKECSLDQITQALLASDVQRAVVSAGARSNDDVLNIYFAEGAPYAAVRNIACKGCPMTRCPHWVNPNGGRGRR